MDQEHIYLLDEEMNRENGMKKSFFIHGIMVILLFLPFVKVDPEKNIDNQFAVQVAFEHEFEKELRPLDQSSSNSTKGSAAEGKTRKEQPNNRKPTEVTKIEVKSPSKSVETQKPKVQIEIKTPKPAPKPTKPIVTDIVTEEAPVVAVEDDIQVEEPELEPAKGPITIPTSKPKAGTSSLPSLEDVLAEIETDSENGDEASDDIGIPTDNAELSEEEMSGGGPGSDDPLADGPGTGEGGSGSGDGESGTDADDGIGDSGAGKGDYDGSGNGIFGRRVVYRNTSALYKHAVSKSGKIVFKVCVNRAGSISFIELLDLETTIDDRKILKSAIDAVQGYKYEPDNSAPKEECGKLTVKIDNFNGLTN